VNSLPFVKSSGLKENFFFCDKDLLEQGCEFYIEQGQWRNNPVCGPRSKGNIHNKVVGLDSTPNYLSFCPLAPARLAKFFSNTHKKLIRFVVILRHPTARLLSAYNHFHPKQPFEEWAREGLKQLRETNMRCEDLKSFDATKSATGPICGGVYVNALRLWGAEFLPSQFLLVPFSSFVTDPRPTLKAVIAQLAYAGKPEDHVLSTIDKIVHTEQKNGGHKHGKKVKMSMSIKKELDSYYKPHTEDLKVYVERHLLHRIRAVGGHGLY
jgi:hypothetical protein